LACAGCKSRIASLIDCAKTFRSREIWSKDSPREGAMIEGRALARPFFVPSPVRRSL
jgi:hypothetical protein